MRPVIKSLMLFLIISILVATNAAVVTFSSFSIYIFYIIIIIIVLNISEVLFWGKNSLVGLVLGLVLIGTIFTMELIAGLIKVEGIDIDLIMLLSYLVLQIIVAVGEEISFRGYILKNLIKETGVRTGVLLSSFMFSIIHIPSFVYYGLNITNGIIAFIVIGMLGVITGLLYLEHGLKAAVGFHFAWNFFQYNIFTLASTQPGLLKSSYPGPGLLTGGGYGPEAGVSGLILVLLILLILVIFVDKNAKA